ncbi:sigma 54-interacting transcriptional regulator [bacterium]|nr:sigma 54-interacting transcriptional regulator [bacterium]
MDLKNAKELLRKPKILTNPHQNILFVAFDTNPRIISLAFYGLAVVAETKVKIDRVHVLTTVKGLWEMKNMGFQIGENGKEDGVIERLCSEYRLEVPLGTTVDILCEEINEVGIFDPNHIINFRVVHSLKHFVEKDDLSLHCVFGNTGRIGGDAALIAGVMLREKDFSYAISINNNPSKNHSFLFPSDLDPNTKSIEICLQEIKSEGFSFVPSGNEDSSVQRINSSSVKIDSVANRTKYKVKSGIVLSNNPIMKENLEELISFANQGLSPILIVGETGTGKEFFTETYVNHALAAKSNNHGKFIPALLSNLSPTLVESELFGHVKGAFTGATKDNKGVFLAAKNGVVFLDEFQNVPMEVQAKLLRFIEKGEIHPVGSEEVRKSNALVIVAMNKNPEELIKDGKLREDLYYRFYGRKITLLPLRDRPEDIEPLIQHFLKKLIVRGNLNVTKISNDLLDFMKDYSWYGNIRELKGFLEDTLRRYARLEPEETTLKINHVSKDILDKISGMHTVPALKKYKSEDGLVDLEAVEKNNIRLALRVSKRNVSKAAEFLGMKRTTLQSRMKKLNISPN